MRDTEVTNTLAERSRIMFIGLLPIRVRPLTLCQVEEIGEMSEDMKGCDDDTDVSDEILSAYTFKRPHDVEMMLDIIVVSLFRRRIFRLLFGRYVKKKIDSKLMKICVSRIKETFDFAFFLSASIFLKGMRKQKKEEETTAHGDSWVES